MNGILNDKQVFTTVEVGKFCMADSTTVITWVEQGKLPAYKTPGGHRRVKRDDLVKFLEKFGMPIPSELTTSAKPRILIVDDDSGVRNFVHSAINKADWDCEIVEAVDGFQAGRMVQTFRPDVVVLDLRLPGIDGLKVCKSLKDDPATKHVKILGISGYIPAENRKVFIDAGAEAYLPKPLDLKELTAILGKLLGVGV